MQTILLQAAGGSILGSLGASWPLLLVPIVMYFFMLRPQQQRQKAQDEFAKSLTPGSEVCTASGIIGKIKKIDDKFVTLEVDNNTFVRMTRTAISKEMTDAIKVK